MVFLQLPHSECRDSQWYYEHSRRLVQCSSLLLLQFWPEGEAQKWAEEVHLESGLSPSALTSNAFLEDG